MTKQSFARGGDGPLPNPKNPDAPYEFVGPGMPNQFYLNQLAATGYTGWYDENGVAAPWPEDFCDPGSGWQPYDEGFRRSRSANRVS
ncbi:MAG: hypothetical protein U0R77_04810 [Mycolicibacterium insubricum]|nr:hypothetical protein [Mycobacterium sp.]